MQRKTFQYRLFPTPAQETTMSATLEECRWLYNRLLEERRLAYETSEESLSLYTQHARIPLLKKERPTLATVHSQVLQNVAVRVDLAYTSQDCSRCHHRQKLTLAERVYRCPCCLLELDRDQNAALNILGIGLDTLGLAPRSRLQ